MKFPRQSKGQKRLVITNQKGGVGKTVLCLQTGFLLAENDKKTLIVDMDGQANITNALLDDDVDAIEGALTSYHLFQDQVDKSLQPIEVYENLYLISSTEELHDIEAEELECVRNPIQWLSQFRDEFDYIIFDTPPSLGRRLMGALAAGTHVVVPLQPARASISGLEALMKTIQAVQQNFNPNLTYIGAIANLLNTRSPKKMKEYEDICKKLGNGIINKPISIRQPIQDSDDDALPVWYQKSGNGRTAGKEVKQAILEIVKRVNK